MQSTYQYTRPRAHFTMPTQIMSGLASSSAIIVNCQTGHSAYVQNGLVVLNLIWQNALIALCPPAPPIAPHLSLKVGLAHLQVFIIVRFHCPLTRDRRPPSRRCPFVTKSSKSESTSWARRPPPDRRAHSNYQPIPKLSILHKPQRRLKS